MAKSQSLKSIQQYVSFTLGKEIFAIPNYPTFIEGVINLRGEIIPIIDLRNRFGMPKTEPTKETRVMLVELKALTVGLIVDRVFEVFQLQDNEIGQMPPISKLSVGRRFVKGVASVREKLIILLDLEVIFSDDETEILSQGLT